MTKAADPMDLAIKNLGLRHTIRYGERTLVVACLIHEADWRPVKASWWRQREAAIIGADLDGNFFLRHCDGSVRYWDHKKQSDSVMAASVREFLHQLV
jgi:hypothetical protein